MTHVFGRCTSGLTSDRGHDCGTRVLAEEYTLVLSETILSFRVLRPCGLGSNNSARQYHGHARERAQPTLGLAELFLVNGLYISVVETTSEVYLERKDRVSAMTMTISTDAWEYAHRE